MRVFISWSGAASRAVAEILADWLPKVIQGVQPFVSAKDIDKGSNWTSELARQLEDAQFGIVCLAPDNLLSPWLNYEAGAITKSVDSRVCPVLFGVEKGEVKPPLSQLQMTSIEIGDFVLLMNSVNRASGNLLQLPAVKESVEVWWPMLEGAIRGVPVPAPTVTPDGIQEPAQPESSSTEMLTELLHRVRQIDARLGRVESASTVDDLEMRPVVDGVIDALRRYKMDSSRVRLSSGGLEVTVSDDLPDVFPGELYKELGDVARLTARNVRISGTDRTVTFDRSGYANEPPF